MPFHICDSVAFACSFSEPIAATKNKAGATGIEWSLWDRFDVNLGRDVTLLEFLDYFKSAHKVRDQPRERLAPSQCPNHFERGSRHLSAPTLASQNMSFTCAA